MATIVASKATTMDAKSEPKANRILVATEPKPKANRTLAVLAATKPKPKATRTLAAAKLANLC